MAKKSPAPAPKEAAFANNPFATLAHDPKLVAKRPPAAPPPVPVRRAPAAPPARLTVRHEAVGRSGKLATRITGVPDGVLAQVAAKLGKALGCHAKVEGGDVILDGSLKERAFAWLERAGDLRKLAEEKPALPASGPAAPPAPAPTPTDASGTYRRNVRPGMRVGIVLKEDQPSGELTLGVVRDLLTSSAEHPHGIKVRLVSGQVGRVKVIYA
jgi:uncharacterized repeat protein (TIGR03833 family)